MKRRLALVLALLALVLAAALAALARDVRRWQETLAGDDVRFLVDPLAPDLWAGPGGTGGDLSRRLLGVDDDLRFRRAERLFIRAHIPASTYDLERERLSAEGAAVALLETVSETDDSGWRRARAATLLGLVAFENARGDPATGRDLVQRALRSFRRAARDDPGADDAKADLELVLTLIRIRGQLGREPKGQEGATGGPGAGLGAPGAGY